MLLNNFISKKNFFVVAEIGNNHEGNLNFAKKLINEAKKAGADAVKFQFFKLKNFYHSDIKKKRFRQLKKYSFSINQILKLKEYADQKKIIFFSTALDLETAKSLNRVQPIFKIASGDNNLLDFIEKILSYKKPTIISTGLLSISQIGKLYEFLKKKSKKEFALMHCVSMYPTPTEKANLDMIQFMKKNYKSAIIGYSDHTLGTKACEYAALMGAQIIEKHFTLSKNFSKFRDHRLSADPKEFKEMVENINLIYQMKGNIKDKLSKEELLNINNMRRSVFSINQIGLRKKIEIKDIVFLRNNSFKKKKGLIKLQGKLSKKKIFKGKLII